MSHDYNSTRQARWRHAQVNPHNDRLRAEKIARKAKQSPKVAFDPNRLCNACGKPSVFNGANPGLTSQVWCESCYVAMAIQLDDDELFYRGVAKVNKAYRHQLHNEAVKAAAAKSRSGQ